MKGASSKRSVLHMQGWREVHDFVKHMTVLSSSFQTFCAQGTPNTCKMYLSLCMHQFLFTSARKKLTNNHVTHEIFITHQFQPGRSLNVKLFILPRIGET